MCKCDLRPQSHMKCEFLFSFLLSVVIMPPVPTQADTSHPGDFSNPLLSSLHLQLPNSVHRVSSSNIITIALFLLKNNVLYGHETSAPSTSVFDANPLLSCGDQPSLPHTSAYPLSCHCQVEDPCLFSHLSSVSTLHGLYQLLPLGNFLWFTHPTDHSACRGSVCVL